MRCSSSKLPAILSAFLTPIVLILSFIHAWNRWGAISVTSEARRARLSTHHFEPAQVNPVAMIIDATAHYRLNAPDSNAEWEALLPSGGHIVHIDDGSSRPSEYTVTMFHQLKCLDIFRREYIQDPPPPVSALTHHCLIYLQQSLLCNLNVAIESTKNALATASRSYEALCKDWREVYNEAERNHRVWDKSSKA